MKVTLNGAGSPRVLTLEDGATVGDALDDAGLDAGKYRVAVGGVRSTGTGTQLRDGDVVDVSPLKTEGN